METQLRPNPVEIQKMMPSSISFEDYYGLSEFPKISHRIVTEPKLIVINQVPKKLAVEEPPSPPPSLVSPTTASISPFKEREKEAVEDEWVTVKNRGKKKAQETTKYESLAEQQMSNSKSKKKSIKKKLKDIQELIKKQAAGEKLDNSQLMKIQSKKSLEKELAALGAN